MDFDQQPHNPYAPPVAHDVHQAFQYELSPLATRGQRFLAALIDAVIGIIVSIPLYVAFGTFDGFPDVQPDATDSILMSLVGIVLFAVVHGYFLMNGQTIGKKLVGTRMVDTTTSQPPGLAKLLLVRYLPFQIVVLVPCIGAIIALANVLFIFREDHRCLHDHLAGTKVIGA